MRLFDKFLLAKSPYRRKLSVQVFGKNHAELLAKGAECDPSSSSPPPHLVIADPKQFCQSQHLFPAEAAISIDDRKLSI